MMNAEVTAENKPACCPYQRMIAEISWRTDEYQGCVQIFVIFLEELFIIFLPHLPVVVVESGLIVFLSG